MKIGGIMTERPINRFLEGRNDEHSKFVRDSNDYGKKKYGKKTTVTVRTVAKNTVQL